MADRDDVARIALALPGTTEAASELAGEAWAARAPRRLVVEQPLRTGA